MEGDELRVGPPQGIEERLARASAGFSTAELPYCESPVLAEATCSAYKPDSSEKYAIDCPSGDHAGPALHPSWRIGNIARGPMLGRDSHTLPHAPPPPCAALSARSKYAQSHPPRADLPEVRPRIARVADEIEHTSISPTGLRMAVEAHGEILTVAAKHGPTRDITNTPGVMERWPAWSPDGQSIAYFSDESGLYALHVASQTGDSQYGALQSRSFRWPRSRPTTSIPCGRPTRSSSPSTTTG